MTTVSFREPSSLLEDTVRALCPLVEGLVAGQASINWSESLLREELVSCLLGSRVRYEMALASTRKLIDAGLLADDVWGASAVNNFQADVFRVLSGQWPGLSRSSHRYPSLRSRQLTRVRDRLAHVPLLQRLSSTDSPKAMRRILVADIPGLGPKQASMFLRNVGVTYDLAVLDTHVLHYMARQDLGSVSVGNISTFRAYELVEEGVVRYANSLGYRTGFVDRAIWVTMKAAGELGI